MNVQTMYNYYMYTSTYTTKIENNLFIINNYNCWKNKIKQFLFILLFYPFVLNNNYNIDNTFDSAIQYYYILQIKIYVKNEPDHYEVSKKQICI